MRFPPALLIALAVLAGSTASAQTNPFARPGPPDPSRLDGRWNGVNLERRSNCANAQNNGNRGTYAQFDVASFSNGEFVVVQSGITGLNCEYRGRTLAEGLGLVFEGTYSCTDGKQGSFRSTAFEATASRLHVRFATQLTGTEACAIEAILDMARFEP